MRQRFLALLFSAGIYVACAPPLQAQTTNSNNSDLVLAQAAANQAPGVALSQPLQQPKAPAAKQCRPTFWDVLVAGGWAYVTESFVPTSGPRPCPDNTPEARQKPAEQEAKPAPPPNQLTYLPAADALRKARLLFIRSRSSWFNPEKLEHELLKRKEFGELGLELTRSADHTELVLEITRKTFTTRFTCSITEPTTQRVLATVTASSLGGEIEPHLAEAIVKQFKAARSKPATEEMKPEEIIWRRMRRQTICL